ncbi:MAG TPA: YjbE family putative metal transport protein [Sphingomonas sp.]
MTFWQLVADDLLHLGSAGALSALAQVVMIDLLLAADNAIVVAALAGGLDRAIRRQVMLLGIGVALVMRILFALAATALLRVPGLPLIGGVLLLWIAWRMWRDVADGQADGPEGAPRPARGFLRTAVSVAVADFSMSLDNVVGVAGAARAHPGILIVGLMLSVLLMGGLASALALIIQRHRWLGWLGLAMIVYVALAMIFDGLHPVLGRAAPW